MLKKYDRMVLHLHNNFLILYKSTNVRLLTKKRTEVMIIRSNQRSPHNPFEPGDVASFKFLNRKFDCMQYEAQLSEYDIDDVTPLLLFRSLSDDKLVRIHLKAMKKLEFINLRVPRDLEVTRL